MGKIIGKDYLLIAMENAKCSQFSRGKTFYCDDDTALYSTALLRL